jgi:hypothetical protein
MSETSICNFLPLNLIPKINIHSLDIKIGHPQYHPFKPTFYNKYVRFCGDKSKIDAPRLSDGFN